MPTWNETHYARAGEFACLLSEVLAAETPFSEFTTAPGLAPSMAPPPPPPAPAVSPAPAAAAPATPSPAVSASPAPAVQPTPPAACATAASTFKKFPWKK